jgi:predicted DNA-binding protein
MKSAYNRLRQEFPDISLLDETSSFSGDEKLQVSLFRTLGQPEKEHVFYKLLISKNSSSDLEGLTNSYKDFIHNGAVDGSNSKNGRSGPSAFNAASRESRWAEDNRPGVRFPMRLSNNLIDEIDAAAQAEGKTRTEWFVSTIERFLSQNSGRTPPDSPEYKSTRAIHIRLSEELNDRIVTASERSGLKKTEWARRVMRSELSSRSTNLDFSQEP